MDALQPILDGYVSVEAQGQCDNVGLQAFIKLELLGQERAQDMVGMRRPRLEVKRGVVVKNELEKLHQEPLRLCGDAGVGENIFPGGRYPVEGRVVGLVDVEPTHSEELNLPERLGRDKLAQQRALGVNDLRRQSDTVRSREGEPFLSLCHLDILSRRGPLVDILQ